MNPTKSDVSDTESREEKPPAMDTNGFLSPSHSHAMGSIVNIKLEDINEEQSAVWQKQLQPYKVPRRKGKRKAEGLLAVICQWMVEHQIGILAFRNSIFNR